VQEGADAYLTEPDVEEKDIVDINVVSAVLFLVLASVFLILLYYFMSNWFLILLVILFCIGGFEGLQTCVVSLLSRWFPRLAATYINVPILGSLSKLGLIVAPFCIAVSVLWGVFRQASFAWVGQDILVHIFTTHSLLCENIGCCHLHAIPCLQKETCIEWSPS
jgi:signal peptide peptidase-like protein 2B